MGEDLSVILRLLPETQKLVIIPDVVYDYRIGGGTSKFMPDMLNDFLHLYHFKQKMAQRYPMPQNVEYLMAVELKNIVLSWLEMCIQSGRYDKCALREEIQECNVKYIEDFLAERITAGKYRRFIKKILK